MTHLQSTNYLLECTHIESVTGDSGHKDRVTKGAAGKGIGWLGQGSEEDLLSAQTLLNSEFFV